MLSELLIKKQDQKFVCILSKLKYWLTLPALPQTSRDTVREEKGNCFHWAFFKACGRNRAAMWLSENTTQLTSLMLCDVQKGHTGSFYKGMKEMKTGLSRTLLPVLFMFTQKFTNIKSQVMPAGYFNSSTSSQLLFQSLILYLCLVHLFLFTTYFPTSSQNQQYLYVLQSKLGAFVLHFHFFYCSETILQFFIKCSYHSR